MKLIMNEISHRDTGDVIIFRGVSDKKIWYALPVIVVQDTPGLIALYWPAGTRGKWRMKSTEEKVTPRDVIAIFQALKEAGALMAELIIM